MIDARSLSSHPPRALAAAGLLLAALAAVPGAAHAQIPGYQYVSPLPNSRVIRIWNDVIIRKGPVIRASTVSPNKIEVVGSSSGTHSGLFEVSDDRRTLVFTPETPYFPGETVSVTLQSGIQTLKGSALPTFSYDFFVSPAPTSVQASRRFDSFASELPVLAAGAAPLRSGDHAPAQTSCDLPSAYPPVTLLDSNEPEGGEVFFAPWTIAGFPFNASGDLLIVDNRGNPIFWRRLSTQRPFDFKLLPDGRLVFIGSDHAFIMDSSYAYVDSFTTGNGYPLDMHEFQLLTNGHVLLMSYDPQPVRMDSIVPGGRADAVVEGLVVQELDRARRVVFQWRSWDYMQITDVASLGVSLTDSVVDYVHGNAIELDHDGNLLISSRHLNEITKIDRATGDIIWRMGLNAKQNQFTFVNDTRGFSHQHDIRRLPNGHLTLFDNGNYLNPPYSRALEFDVDEAARTATLAWSFETAPETFGGFMGNVQRRASGGTMIGWGGNGSTNFRLTDLNADGTPAFELGLPPLVYSYRAYRFPWRTNRLVTSGVLDFGLVPALGVPITLPLTVTNGSRTPVTIDCVTATHPAFSVEAALPVTLDPGASTVLVVAFNPNYQGAWNERLYVRSMNDSELVAAAVDLKATTNPVNAVGGDRTASFAFHEVRPNPAGARATFVFDLPRAARVTLEIFSPSGRRVRTVYSGVRAAGRHELPWNAAGLPRGVYLARLTAGELVAARKFVRMD